MYTFTSIIYASEICQIYKGGRLIAAGILVSCIVRYFHYGLGASAAEYGIIAVGAAVMLILVVEGFVSRLYRPL